MDNLSFEWGEFSSKAYFSLIDSTARLNIWSGSVRSGKTITSLVRWINFIQTAPRGRLLMVGKTERTLKRNILDDLQAMVSKKNYKKTSDGSINVFGRIIDLVGANDERAENKIRGATYCGAYCDEITLYPESFFKMLLSRLSVKGSKLFGTTNPDSPYHWFKVDYLDNTKIDLKSFVFTIDDNPNLDEDYKINIKKEYSGMWFKRFILGLWVQAAGAIYQNYSEEKNMIENIRNVFDRYFVGIDYGINNPTTFVLVGRYEAKYYVIKEFYHDGRTQGQKTDKYFAQKLKEFILNYNISEIFLDPSALSFKVELREININVSDAQNDVLNGIRKLSSILDNNRLFIHNSCSNLNREFQSYIWDEKAQKKGEDKPLKASDHVLDALRYVIYTLEAQSKGELKQIQVNDKVKDYKNYR